jgi:hypothetical protein
MVKLAMHGPKQAAKLAGITEALLALWIEQGRVKPTHVLSTAHVKVPGRPPGEELFGFGRFMFDDAAIEQIRKLAENGNGQQDKSRTGSHSSGEKSQRRGRSAKPSPDAEFLTVQQIAERWELSPDTITRIFRDEPGVIPLGKENPRGKRKRVTLRIPVEVVERVKRKRAKK